MAKLKSIRVREIKVLGERRALDPRRVTSLAESMAVLGQKTPITVYIREDGAIALVAGLHRLKAAELLGWKDIDSFISKDKKLERSLWSNSENLHHNALTKLERAEGIANWVRDLKQLNEKSKDKFAGGNQPTDKGISRAGKQLGYSRKTIHRALKIANISDKAKNRAKQAGFDRNQRALIAIADEPTRKAQVRKVRELLIKAGPSNGAKAKPKALSQAERKQLRELKRRLKKTASLKQAILNASPLVRRKFAGQIIKLGRSARPNKSTS
jgi:ParB/RepB/Spo0J family partition protein